MLVSEFLTHLRDELGDGGKTRYQSDAPLVRMLQKSIVRAQGVLYRNGISFGRNKYTFDTVAGTSTYALPSDFASVYGMWRTDQHKPLQHRTTDQFENIISAQECSNYTVLDDDLIIAGTPTTVIPLALYYWPIAPTVAIGDEMPWRGRLDYIILDYLKIRCFNIDEMDTTADIQMMQDLENNIVSQFAERDPLVVKHRGWLDNGS